MSCSPSRKLCSQKGAVSFAGPKRILRRATEGVLDTYLGKPISQERTEIGGAPAVVLDYRLPDYDDHELPGYHGIAIAVLVDNALYVVNGILTSEDPRAKVKQQRLLTSLQVHN